MFAWFGYIIIQIPTVHKKKIQGAKYQRVLYNLTKMLMQLHVGLINMFILVKKLKRVFEISKNTIF